MSKKRRKSEESIPLTLFQELQLGRLTRSQKRNFMSDTYNEINRQK